MKFKINEIVRIKKYSKNGINSHGRIKAIKDGKYWVTNYNMPFSGTISDFFFEDELDKTIRN